MRNQSGHASDGGGICGVKRESRGGAATDVKDAMLNGTKKITEFK